MEQLKAKVVEQAKASRDFLVPASRMEITENLQMGVWLESGREYMPISEYAHGQIASKLDIPRKYYNKMMAKQPQLLAQNANTWLREDEKVRLVRTMGGGVRAFLSDSYRPIDNFPVLQAILPVIQDMGVIIKSAEVTERRLYLQVITPNLKAEVKEGEAVYAGFTISNSEIGSGNISFASMLYYLVCKNGQIGATNFKKRHVGRKLGNGVEGAFDMTDFTDRTKQLDDATFISMVQDMTRASLNEAKFMEQIELAKDATHREVEPAKVQTVVTEVAKKYSFNDGEKDDVFERFIRGNDYTQFGLGSAVTNLANDEKLTFDRTIELQKVGGDIMALANGEWAEVNK